MGKYKKPGKVNFVSFLLFVGLLAGGYAGYQFGPHYYHKWKAKGILSDAANQAYPKRHKEDWDLQAYLSELQTKTEKRLKELGIEDPALRVKVTIHPTEIIAEANYKVVIKHPLVNKQTVLYFRPRNSISKADRPF